MKYFLKMVHFCFSFFLEMELKQNHSFKNVEFFCIKTEELRSWLKQELNKEFPCVIPCLQLKWPPKHKKNAGICQFCKSSQQWEGIFFAHIPTQEIEFLVQRESPFTWCFSVRDLPPLSRLNNKGTQMWRSFAESLSGDTVHWHLWCLDQALWPQEHPNSAKGFGLTQWLQRPLGWYSLSSHWFYQKKLKHCPWTKCLDI